MYHTQTEGSRELPGEDHVLWEIEVWICCQSVGTKVKPNL